MKNFNHVIFIMSHNSKEMTQKVYDSLSKQSDNVFVLENSYIENEKFLNDKTIDFGEKNIGMGGFVDYIIDYALDKENLFIGMFNNDIFDIPDNFINKIEKYFISAAGVVHPSLNDDGCAYPQMKNQSSSGSRFVDFVEGVCPFVNVEVLKQMKKYSPTHYYGWYDIVCSRISSKVLGLCNIVTDDVVVSHTRSGVRKKMESVDKNNTEYQTLADKTFNDWVLKNNIPREYYIK